MCFLDYSLEHKSYHYYDLVKQCIHISRYVIFLEHVPYYSKQSFDFVSPTSSLVDISFLDFSTSVATSDSLTPPLEPIEFANSECIESSECVKSNNFD